MRVIEEQTIRAAAGESIALAAAERAFRALAEGDVQLPPPMGLSVPQVDGEVHVKSAYLDGAPSFAVKIASGFYQNPTRGLPSGAGLILLFSSETGFPIAVLADNGYLTELRTAAAGALAARLLAPESIDTVAVLGTGTQARFQLRALAAIRSWRQTVAWSRDPSNVARYCREMESQLGGAWAPAESADAAVRGADLVITVTPSRAPLFSADALRAHATVIAVGSDGPDKRELPTAALERADKIVVDRTSQCLALGELHHAVEEGAFGPERIHAELGDVLLGRSPGREGDELIVCDLTGVGAQDAAIAEAVWEKLADSA